MFPTQDEEDNGKYGEEEEGGQDEEEGDLAGEEGR
jgi:hypothetical protein